MQLAKATRFREAGPNRLPILRIGNYADGFSEDVDFVEINKETLIAERRHNPHAHRRNTWESSYRLSRCISQQHFSPELRETTSFAQVFDQLAGHGGGSGIHSPEVGKIGTT